MGGQINAHTGGHMGGIGGHVSQMGQMSGGQHQEQHQAMGGAYHQPAANHLPAGEAIPGMGELAMGGPGMNGGMMAGMMGGIGSGAMGSFSGGSTQAPMPQRSAKKVPDWLVQTLKEKEALAEKQKKKEGLSLSTDVGSSLPGGAGNISGYNLVHSPSPSPPGSPAEGTDGKGRSKPSWQDDSDDDSADEVSPTKSHREKRASSTGSASGSIGGARNGGVKPSGILKKSGAAKRGMGRAMLDDEDDETASTAAETSVMDDETRASFDREIRRVLTQVLKEGTVNISREVAASAVEEARHSAIASQASRRSADLAEGLTANAQQPKVRRKEQREQKKAMGALIGGYGSGSASESEGDVSPPPANIAPSATIFGDNNGALDQSKGEQDSKISAVTAPILAPASARKETVMVGGKWPLPAWADPPHEYPLPDGLSVVVETIGPDLERVKTQELAFSTTVMGRFEEQSAFVVEDSSASRCHAAIL